MKALFYLIMALLVLMGASCGSTSTQVEYDDGRVEWIENPNNVALGRGDTVVVYNYFSGGFSNKEVYGYYKGKLPKYSIDSTYLIVYHKAVVLQP